MIFVLKNYKNTVNIDNMNRLHPFYMVYLDMDGGVVCNHLSPKQLLDTLRHLCKGSTAPLASLCRAFNRETRDGKDMKAYSKLLGDAIASILEVKEESELESFLGGSQMSFFGNTIHGLDDFELVAFVVIRNEEGV